VKKEELTSTFFRELGDLPSPLNGQDSKQLDSPKSTPTPAESLQKTSLESQTSETLKTSTEKTSKIRRSSQEDFLVSHTVMVGSDEARKMTERSGRKWLELYQKRDPVGSLLKMCLVSSRWNSTRCLMTWRISTTPRMRSLFRLAPLMRPTGETEFGFLPTPCGTSNQGRNHVVGRLDEWGGSANPFRGTNLGKQRCASFEEWMMGFPIGWTELTQSETQ